MLIDAFPFQNVIFSITTDKIYLKYQAENLIKLRSLGCSTELSAAKQTRMKSAKTNLFLALFILLSSDK